MRATWRLNLAMSAYVIVLLVSKDADAAYSIVNGGFDAQGAEVNNIATAQPTGWFTFSNAVGSFSDSMLYGPFNNGVWDFNGLLLGNDTPFPNDGTTEQAFVYQSVGTYNSESSITVTGAVYNRTNSNLVGDFDIAIFYSDPGAFTPAVGSDLAGSAAVLVGEQTLTEGTTFPTLTGVIGQSAPWSTIFSFAGSGITVGDSVWLRIGDGGNPTLTLADQPVLDNINIAPCTLGDANCNGTADINTDLAAIRANFRKTTGVTRAMGDVDGSGDVDFLDYFQWRTQYLLQNPGSGSSVPGLFGPVPEPSSALLFGAGVIGALGLCRQRPVRRGNSA